MRLYCIKYEVYDQKSNNNINQTGGLSKLNNIIISINYKIKIEYEKDNNNRIPKELTSYNIIELIKNKKNFIKEEFNLTNQEYLKLQKMFHPRIYLGKYKLFKKNSVDNLLKKPLPILNYNFITGSRAVMELNMLHDVLDLNMIKKKII